MKKKNILDRILTDLEIDLDNFEIDTEFEIDTDFELEDSFNIKL